MWFLDLLRPAKNIQQLSSKQAVNTLYPYWRWRIFFGMYAGYAFFYFTRTTLKILNPFITKEFGWTKSEIAVFALLFSLVYGGSKLLSGILSDRSNPRYFMAFGLLITGIINLCIGTTSSFMLIALLWAFNGFFQGFGWPPCARLLTHWYSQSERGSWWGMWNSSHNMGAAAISAIAWVLLQYEYSWRYGFFLPGILCIGGAFLLVYVLRDKPESLGLPPIEEYRNEPKEVQKSGKREKESDSEIFWKYVVSNVNIWRLAGAYFFIYILRTAMTDWGAFFLIEFKGHALSSSMFPPLCIEAGGIAGAFSAGALSDRLFNGRRAPVNIGFTIAAVVALYMVWTLPHAQYTLAYITLFFMGFFIFGPQMLIGVAAAELSHKDAAGSSTGFVGLFAYFGAASATVPLAWIADTYGWSSFFVAIATCAAVTVVLLLPLWNAKTYERDYKVEATNE